MKSLKISLENFFRTHKRKINYSKLISIFKILPEDYSIFKETIFELEKEGKIIGDKDGNYTYIPNNFYLKVGLLLKSAKNHFYLNLGKGVIVTIPTANLNGAEKGDYVYVEIEKGTKNAKQLIGNVIRIVTKPTIELDEFITNVKLNKNYKKNYFYVSKENEPIYIPSHELNKAYIDDIVTVKVINENNMKYGKVVKIEKRHPKNHVFEYKNANGTLKWIPLETYPYEVNINNIQKEKFNEGDKIYCRVSLDNTVEYLGRISEDNTLNSNISNLIKLYNFQNEFNSKVIKESKNISSLIGQDEIDKRVDLRTLLTITIDGESAKDLDDSISLEKIDNGYRLYVHIADVSHYVSYDSKIFEESKNRTTSIYPPNGVIPMLPRVLSNKVCSLNPNEDKLTLTFMVDIDYYGNILDYKIFKSIINSNKRMTYDKVNKVLDNIEIDDEYIPYINLLRELDKFNNILEKRRINRGFICFDAPEKEFSIDPLGNVNSVHDRDKGKSQLIIENCMLLANEVGSSFVYYFSLPLFYRNHEAPNHQQLGKLKTKLKEFKQYIQVINRIENPKILQRILLTLTDGKSEEEKKFISKLMLNSMNRAYYSTNNIGHYALALDKYATFTSPIRRFPDLVNHHIISCILDGKVEEIDNILEDFEQSCLECSMKQELVEQFERDVELLLITDYMKEYYEKEMDSKILFINNDKVYVKTYNGFYGNIKIQKNSVKDNNIYIGGKKYKIGDNIPVIIKYVKEKTNEIRFIPSSEKVKVLKKEEN